MKSVVATVATEPDVGGFWLVDIGAASSQNTFCFEASTDHQIWTPINGQRLVGPGPQLGSIISNAVAGGPAKYRGSTGSFRFIRVVQTLSDKTAVIVHLTTDKPPVVYIIDEEKDVEDLINSR